VSAPEAAGSGTIFSKGNLERLGLSLEGDGFLLSLRRGAMKSVSENSLKAWRR
jgi:hypothetical protein